MLAFPGFFVFALAIYPVQLFYKGQQAINLIPASIHHSSCMFHPSPLSLLLLAQWLRPSSVRPSPSFESRPIPLRFSPSYWHHYQSSRRVTISYPPSFQLQPRNHPTVASQPQSICLPPPSKRQNSSAVLSTGTSKSASTSAAMSSSKAASSNTVASATVKQALGAMGADASESYRLDLPVSLDCLLHFCRSDR